MKLRKISFIEYQSGENCFELNPETKTVFTCVGRTTATSALPDEPPGCFGVDDDCGGEKAPKGRAIWTEKLLHWIRELEMLPVASLAAGSSEIHSHASSS